MIKIFMALIIINTSIEKGLDKVVHSSKEVVSSAYTGKASWYGSSWDGRLTANGEVFNHKKMTCASNKLKMGTKIRVTNLSNNKSVVCRVNDTGGFAKYGRILDMSLGSFRTIASESTGVINVRIEVIKW